MNWLVIFFYICLGIFLLGKSFLGLPMGTITGVISLLIGVIMLFIELRLNRS